MKETEIINGDWMGETSSTVRVSALLIGIAGLCLDIAHFSDYPHSRQDLIDTIGPIGMHIGNFGASFLSAIAGTICGPILFEELVCLTPDKTQSKIREYLPPKKTAVIFGLIAPIVGNIIAEAELFTGRNVYEHSGDIAMGIFATCIGVLSSRLIYYNFIEFSKSLVDDVD